MPQKSAVNDQTSTITYLCLLLWFKLDLHLSFITVCTHCLTPLIIQSDL